MWRKVGNINTVLKSDGALLYQTVAYQYFASDTPSPNFRLSISKYPDGKTSIIIEANTPEQYVTLRKAYRLAGFPKPDNLDLRMNCLALLQSSKEVALHFLMTLKNIDPSFAEIENEIYDLLGIDLSQQYEMPVWIKNDADQTRISFRSAEKIELDIAQFEIISNKHNHFTFSVLAANQGSYEDLIYVLTQLGFPEPLESEKQSQRLLFYFDADTLYKMEILLNALRPFCCNKSVIDDVYRSTLNLLPTSNYSNTTCQQETVLTREQCDSPLKNFSLFETADKSTAIARSEPESNSRSRSATS